MSTLTEVEAPFAISQYEVLLGDVIEAQQKALRPCVFDYHTKAGSTAAESYLFGLRKLKSRIEDALFSGKLVDEQASELAEQVLDLIRPHHSQLDAFAKAKAEWVEAPKTVHDHVIQLGVVPFGSTSAMVQARIVMLDEVQLDQLQEYREVTAAAIVTSRQQLQVALAAALAGEEQERELARDRDDRVRRWVQEWWAYVEAQAAAADAIADEEARAAQAEAKLAAAVTIPPITEPAPRRVCIPSPPGAVDAANATRRRLRLKEQLQTALAGMNREAVVASIIDGRLHPAVVVDWEGVG